MPLPVPPGAVTVFAKHRPPGGEAGVQGAAARDHAARLMGVQAGQHRRAGGRAVVRDGVVPAEGDRPLTQALKVRGQAHAAPGDRAEPLREAQLVDHDHEDVRPPYGRGRRCDAPCRLGGGGSARPCRRPVTVAAATGDRGARARQQAAGDRAALQEGAPVGLLIWFHACGARPDRWPEGVAGVGARRSGRVCGPAHSWGRVGFCPCGRGRSGLRTNDIEHLRDCLLDL